MTPNEQLWLISFIASAIFNVFFLCFFIFVLNPLLKRQYENFRNFINRNRGFGYLLVLHPEGRLEEVFIKMESEMTYDEGKYILKSDCVFQHRGMPALLYNKGDNEPINLKNLQLSETFIFRSASFLDSLIIKIKAYAEAKAFKKFEMIMLLLVVIIALGILTLIASGYGAYMVQMLKENVMPMLDLIQQQLSSIPIVANVPK
jgi:hypothetical protein